MTVNSSFHTTTVKHADMKHSGDTVQIDGRNFTLGRRLGGGSEGAVFDIDDHSGVITKLINTRNMSPADIEEVKKRLVWLRDDVGVGMKLKQNLAIPKAVLDEDLGYVMKKAVNYRSLNTYLRHPFGNAFADWCKNEYRLKKRLQICALIFQILEQIHISGLIFTDLSPNNIMVSSEENNVVFIDTDNMRRKEDVYCGVLGTPGYMAPEIYYWEDKKLREQRENCKLSDDILPAVGKISVDSDVFSAAVIAFQLLTFQHPYEGDVAEEGTPDELEKALRCETDYILEVNGGNPSTCNSFVKHFDNGTLGTEKLRQLFTQTFVGGKHRPLLRPTALEFEEAFSEASDMIVSCSSCGAEQFFTPQNKDTCWQCGKVISFQYCLRIFAIFAEKDRSKILGAILEDRLDNLPSESNQKPFLMSELLFVPDETVYLYPRHIKSNPEDRKQVWGTLRILSESEGRAEIRINPDSGMNNCELFDRVSKKWIPQSSQTNFLFNDKWINFGLTDTRAGKMRLVGRVFKSTN